MRHHMKTAFWLMVAFAFWTNLYAQRGGGPINETNCSTITTANIEGSVDINLQGNVDVVDFTVTYNGTTYDGLPAGVFTLPNISADATTVLIVANDAGTNTDTITCNLDFAPPACVASQIPMDIVDVGTVISLFLDTTNAVEVTIDGVSMTPDVDPDNNFNVQWEATHVAVAATTLTATVTNADGETTTCNWTVEINCIDPIFVDVAQIGQTGITIVGTPDCTYTIRISEGGSVTDYDVTVDADGTGTLNVVVPSSATLEVGPQGLPFVTDSFTTVPALGVWGLCLFITVLLAAALMITRKNQVPAVQRIKTKHHP